MLINQQAICPSPTTVSMPYLRRYCVIARRTGVKAYDLFETMNRQAYFRDRQVYRFDAAERNIATLMAIRAGEVNAMDSDLYDPTFMEVGRPEPRHPMKMNCAGWFHQHGVEVDMAVYDNEEWDNRCVEATIQAEEVAAAENDDGIGDFEVDEDMTNELFADDDSINREIFDFISRAQDDEDEIAEL